MFDCDSGLIYTYYYYVYEFLTLNVHEDETKTRHKTLQHQGPDPYSDCNSIHRQSDLKCIEIVSQIVLKSSIAHYRTTF